MDRQRGSAAFRGWVAAGWDRDGRAARIFFPAFSIQPSFQLGKGEGTVMDGTCGGTIEKGGFDVFAVDVGGEFAGDGDVGKGFVFGERAPGREARACHRLQAGGGCWLMVAG